MDALKKNLRQEHVLIHEFLSTFYGMFLFQFSCTCNMYQNMLANKLLRQHIQSVKVHWNGKRSAEAFAYLQKCIKLRNLAITVSRATTQNLTERETMMNDNFAYSKRDRLSEALGIDELIELRGLHSVKVLHISARQGMRRSEEERANLQKFLEKNLLEPRDLEPEGSDED